MSKYNDELGKLHFTEEGKNKLMNNIKQNADENKIVKFNRLSKVAVVAASLCLVSGTVFATGVLEPVTDIIAPFFGSSVAQTEVIDKIGVPIGASDTSDGITITAEAIMGTTNHVAIIYKLSNEDGSKIELPVDADQTYITPIGAHNYGTNFNVNGGSTGSMACELGDDGYFRLIEKKSFDNELPNGKNVTATFENLMYLDANGSLTTLSDGNWKIKYEFSYEDITTEIPVNQTFEREGLEFTIEQISISPISLDVDYTVNSVPDFMNRPIDGEITDISEHQLYRGIDLFITKTDGTIVDMTNAGGGFTNNETYVTGHKGGVLDEIVPLDEILSITVGEIEIFI